MLLGRIQADRQVAIPALAEPVVVRPRFGGEASRCRLRPPCRRTFPAVPCSRRRAARTAGRSAAAPPSAVRGTAAPAGRHRPQPPRPPIGLCTGKDRPLEFRGYISWRVFLFSLIIFSYQFTVYSLRFSAICNHQFAIIPPISNPQSLSPVFIVWSSKVRFCHFSG